jgi:hypothetical protein
VPVKVTIRHGAAFAGDTSVAIIRQMIEKVFIGVARFIGMLSDQKQEACFISPTHLYANDAIALAFSFNLLTQRQEHAWLFYRKYSHLMLWKSIVRENPQGGEAQIQRVPNLASPRSIAAAYPEIPGHLRQGWCNVSV